MAKKEDKAKIIDELEKVFSECTVGIITDYRGITDAEITALRRRLDKSETKFRVIKNTLACFAAEKAGKEQMKSLLVGPTSFAYTYGDVVQPAKILNDYIKETKGAITIRGGILGDSVLSSADVISLANMPSREVLIAKVLGGMQAPIYGVASCLAGPIRGFMTVLQGRKDQLEGK